MQEVLENGELRPITPIEAEFLRLWFSHGDTAKAAMDSKLYRVRKGSKRSTEKISAASKGAKTLRLLQPQISEMMAQAGLSPMEILAPLKEGIFATESHVVKKTTITGIGKDAVRVETQELVHTPHYMARAKFVEMALKVHQILISVPSSINVRAEASAGAHAAAGASARSGDLKGKTIDELREIMDRENRARSAPRKLLKSA